MIEMLLHVNGENHARRVTMWAPRFVVLDDRSKRNPTAARLEVQIDGCRFGSIPVYLPEGIRSWEAEVPIEPRSECQTQAPSKAEIVIPPASDGERHALREFLDAADEFFFELDTSPQQCRAVVERYVKLRAAVAEAAVARLKEWVAANGEREARHA